MDQEHINCTKGTWTPIKELGVLAVKEGINLANFNVGDLPKEEQYYNLLLASSSKLMCKRINQVSKLILQKIESQSSSPLKEKELPFKLWFSLLQTSMPKELRLRDYSTHPIEELLEIFKISMQFLSDEEKERVREQLINLEL